MSIRYKEIKAVHIADLSNLLKKYNQLQDFDSGNVKCYVCSDVITLENAGSVKHKGGRLYLTCNKTSCYGKVVKNM